MHVQRSALLPLAYVCGLGNGAVGGPLNFYFRPQPAQ
jgi:hypothetical protein